MKAPKPPLPPKGLKIISGGQAGVDRAALDFALQHGFAHGGWCPKDRGAEDGPIAARYDLQETPSSDPAQRTEWNVRDSDGTVIFSNGRTLSGGSRLTAALAAHYHKPCLHLHPGSVDPAGKLTHFLRDHRIQVLNVAGPRASQEPQVGEFVVRVLKRVFLRKGHTHRKNSKA